MSKTAAEKEKSIMSNPLKEALITLAENEGFTGNLSATIEMLNSSKMRDLTGVEFGMSESIGNLVLALAQAKLSMGSATVVKDANNPGFKSKYATLDATLDKVQQHLANHGVEVIQLPTGDRLYTMLCHSSGEFIHSYYKIEAESNNRNTKEQAKGAAITYARRYTLQAVLGVAPGDDDDGNSTGSTSWSNAKSNNPAPAAPAAASKPASNNKKSSNTKNLVDLFSDLAKASTNDELDHVKTAARGLFSSKKITKEEGIDIANKVEAKRSELGLSNEETAEV